MDGLASGQFDPALVTACVGSPFRTNQRGKQLRQHIHTPENGVVSAKRCCHYSLDVPQESVEFVQKSVEMYFEVVMKELQRAAKLRRSASGAAPASPISLEWPTIQPSRTKILKMHKSLPHLVCRSSNLD